MKNNPTAEEKLSKLHVQLSRARELWLEKLMPKLLPPGLVRIAKSKKPLHRELVQSYLTRRQIRVIESPDKIELAVGDQIVSRLVVSFSGGELQVNATTTEDMPAEPIP